MEKWKKIVLSFLSGLAILLISWIYQNYDYSLNKEDGFIKNMFLVKDLVYASPSEAKADFVFINTGKDLALIEDSIDYGNLAVSDRSKIYKFIHYLNLLPARPLFTVLDIEFYYPFTTDPEVDRMLEAELMRNDSTVIPVLKDADDQYKKPLYDRVRFGYSNYRTFAANFNKFRIMNQGKIPSIPIILHEYINKVVYKDNFFYPTCNGRLCLSSIWPNYYLRNEDVSGLVYQDSLNKIRDDDTRRAKGNVTAQYYNIGELLLDLEIDSTRYGQFFKDKIVIVGNFENDVHGTPVGKMAGPVLLANIYLSLVNDQHIISFWLAALLVLSFSALSYVAWFGKIPELKFNFRFLFSSYVVKFIRAYVSYFGCMFLLSVLVLLLFNVQVALFVPSLLFTGIEYVRHKKYKVQPKAVNE